MRRTIIIILIVLLAIVGVWYFYTRSKNGGVSPVSNALKVFFPTSKSGSTGVFGQVGGVAAAPAPSVSQTGSAFKEISAGPVAGYTSFYTQPVTTVFPVAPTTSKKVTPKPTAPTVANTSIVPFPGQTAADHTIRYVSRNNGYVYEIKGTAIPLQITNIFIPNIYEAYFADNNNTAILRFLQNDEKTISTYSVPIPPLNSDGTRTQLSGTYLPQSISALAVSPDGTRIARIITDTNGASVSISNSVGTNIKTVARSPFREWLPFWSDSALYIQTKAASIANGFLYMVNQQTAQLQRIVGDTPGLTASVSPSGTYVLYSESVLNGFVTKILNTKTGAANPIQLSILPENCVWLQNEDLICAGNNTTPNGTYPDDWYSGIMHFSDQLYSINTTSNTYTVLYDGQGQSFDMTNLQVDESQQILYFIDKNTGLLWQFNY